MATLHFDANASLVRVNAASLSKWLVRMPKQDRTRVRCLERDDMARDDDEAAGKLCWRQLWQRSAASTDSKLGFLVDGVPNGIRTRVFTVKG
jgi:hypothetical protein